MIRELMHTDLPDPVVPAMSIWGILARSATMTWPAISRPRATVSLPFEAAKALLLFDPYTGALLESYLSKGSTGAFLS